MHLNDSIQKALSTCIGNLAAAWVKSAIGKDPDAAVAEFKESCLAIFKDHLRNLATRHASAAIQALCMLPAITHAILKTTNTACSEDQFVGIAMGSVETMARKLSDGFGVNLLDEEMEGTIADLASSTWRGEPLG